jgi:hypothetical protein
MPKASLGSKGVEEIEKRRLAGPFSQIKSPGLFSLGFLFGGQQTILSTILA